MSVRAPVRVAAAGVLVAICLFAGGCGSSESSTGQPQARKVLVYTMPVKKGGFGDQPQVMYLASMTGVNGVRVGVGSLPAVSPDGRWVAYTVGSLDQPHGTGLVNTATHAVTRLSATLVPVAWSPDSTSLLVTSPHVYGRYEIVRIPSGKVEHALKLPDQSQSASFSPDGSSLVYEHWQGQAYRPDIYTIPVSGGSPRRLTEDLRSGDPVWGPDGIAFERYGPSCAHCPGDVWLMNPRGGNLRRLTHTNNYARPVGWSADGSRLLAATGPDENGTLYAITLPGGQVRAITSPIPGLLPVGFSRDGNTALFILNCSSHLAAKPMAETVPFAGGAPTILRRGACDANWNA